jgi:hypothetical protein
MRTIRRLTMWMWVISIVMGASAHTQAQTTANGPYYAEPAWDQKLNCTATTNCRRFIVLSNWNSEAVLDRETGLVWERSPATTNHTWSAARFECTSRTVGGRKGWRLPSVHELASLVDPSQSFPSLPPGHPFTNTQTFFGYWSATTDAVVPTGAWSVDFGGGGVGANAKDFGSNHGWCVRGAMNADQY